MPLLTRARLGEYFVEFLSLGGEYLLKSSAPQRSLI